MNMSIELLDRFCHVGPGSHVHQNVYSNPIPSAISCSTTVVQNRTLGQHVLRRWLRYLGHVCIHLPMLACSILLDANRPILRG